MRRAMSVCVPVIGLIMAMAACGDDDDEEPAPPVSEEVQVVAAVNGLFDAMREQDGETACSLLTERGQRLFEVVARRESAAELGEIPDCEATIAAVEPLLEDQEAEGPADHTYEPGDVHVQEGRGQAQVQCEFRGAAFVRQIGGEWLVDIPACID